MYKAEIVADSINTAGNRLTTFYLQYPRIIHAEMLRHRTMSRSVSSSRAIPVKRMIQQVREMAYVPAEWRMNESGMQGWTVADGKTLRAAQVIWADAAFVMTDCAESLAALGIHKQHVNRLLEPFVWVEEVVSATEWHNFFSLRTDGNADPAIQVIATMMRYSYEVATPYEIVTGSWHTPYIRDDEQSLPIVTKQKVSAARCARVSYSLRNGKISDAQSDVALFDKLSSSRHWSPLEHVAMATSEPVRIGNFVGWKQLRKFYDNEAGGDYR